MDTEIDLTEETRTCTHCRLDLPISEFRIDRNGIRSFWCIECTEMAPRRPKRRKLRPAPSFERRAVDSTLTTLYRASVLLEIAAKAVQGATAGVLTLTEGHDTRKRP